ncbi:MAG: PPOX class F420-dependent oxidoreductase [Nitrososphaerales archaeon]
MFPEPGVQYLKSQYLARLATVSSKGQPDVVPVGFEFDGTYFRVGSHDQEIFHKSLKYRNVRDGNKLVSLVVDDLESIDPWKPRSVKIYGTAEVFEHYGRFGPGKYLRVTPKISWSFGIKGLKINEGYKLKNIHG